MQDSFNAQNNVNHTTNRISVAGQISQIMIKLLILRSGAAIGGLVMVKIIM